MLDEVKIDVKTAAMAVVAGAAASAMPERCVSSGYAMSREPSLQEQRAFKRGAFASSACGLRVAQEVAAGNANCCVKCNKMNGSVIFSRK